MFLVRKEMGRNERYDRWCTSLYALLQSCDVYTRIHMKSVAKYARVLAQTVASRPGVALDVDSVVQAAALHDVGKKDIPFDILFKPGRLTDSQFDVMKQHPVKGANMLIGWLNESGADEENLMCNVLVQGALYHHERWDGSGYPFGLKGNQIPLGAQIVALADAYDALTALRPYKEPRMHEEAIDMIAQGRCGAFSPLLLRDLVIAQKQLKACLEEPERIPL